MLKFFRQFKLKLLGEEKTKKYIWYALGEIILIVIGILIALQLENWNQELKSNTQEKRILNDLRIEFKNNLEGLNLVIKEKEGIIDICNLFLEKTGPNSKWDEELNFDSLLVKTVVSGWKFYPETGVLSEILNSGKLELIDNDSLRYILSSLPGNIDRLHYEDDMVINDLHNTYLPFLSKNYPIRNASKYESGILSTSQRIMLKEIMNSEFSSPPAILLKKMEFENLINIQLLWVSFSLHRYHIQKDIYQKALEIINNEL
ncbi:MAG: DUF6090 family protein [Balneolaceae bacterium]|nr:DUF6090 family protein [Balneolaceae bacterium]